MTHSSSLFSHYIWLLLAFRQSFWILCISLTSTQTKWLKKIQTFIVSQSWKLKVQNFGSHTLVLKRSKNLFHGFLLPHSVTLVSLGLQLSNTNLACCHMAFSLSSYCFIRMSDISDQGPTFLQQDLILTNICKVLIN